MTIDQTPSTFDAWCIVELFGHNKIAGRVTEQVIAGEGFVRIDVPAVKDQAGFTRLFGPGAIYSIIPTTEAIVRAFVAGSVGAPIKPYEIESLQQLASGRTERAPEEEPESDDPPDF